MKGNVIDLVVVVGRSIQFQEIRQYLRVPPQKHKDQQKAQDTGSGTFTVYE